MSVDTFQETQPLTAKESDDGWLYYWVNNIHAYSPATWLVGDICHFCRLSFGEGRHHKPLVKP